MAEPQPEPLQPLDPAHPGQEPARSERIPPRLRRPVHLRVPAMIAVFIGGFFGTAAREALSLAFPSLDGVSWIIYAINILGAFALGFLLDALVRLGPDRGLRRTVRLTVGTGFMGGFTTYSTFALDAAHLTLRGMAPAGISFAVLTVLLGGLASWAGIGLAALLTSRNSGGGR